MDTVLIEGRGLWKRYRLPHKELVVLRGADVCVHEGEVVAVVGRSGAGKSTLLHVLGGLDRPDAGTVALAGKGLYSVSPATRGTRRGKSVGFVFQSYHLLPELSVLDNVALPGMLARGDASRRRARARTLLESVGLGVRMDHMPQELSGGEQQRAAIARALMNDPAVILADEPTGNLDDATGDAVLELLFDMVRRDGRAMVVVTHSAEVAQRCERVLHLREGKLVAASDVELLSHEEKELGELPFRPLPRYLTRSVRAAIVATACCLGGLAAAWVCYMHMDCPRYLRVAAVAIGLVGGLAGIVATIMGGISKRRPGLAVLGGLAFPLGLLFVACAENLHERVVEETP